MSRLVPDGYYTLAKMLKELDIEYKEFWSIYDSNRDKFDTIKLNLSSRVYAIKDIPLYYSFIYLDDECSDINIFTRIESWRLKDGRYKVLLKECNECPTIEETLTEEQLINKINNNKLIHYDLNNYNNTTNMFFSHYYFN